MMTIEQAKKLYDEQNAFSIRTQYGTLRFCWLQNIPNDFDVSIRYLWEGEQITRDFDRSDIVITKVELT